MKRLLLFSLLLIVLSCNKTTNNTYVLDSKPSYIVSGLSNLTLTNGSSSIAYESVTIMYEDSTQEFITLGLNGLPTGVTLDSSYWVGSGLPTFSTTIRLYDTTTAGATPGNYPLTLTATNQEGRTTSYTFSLKIKAQIPCSTYLTGSYSYCSSCTSSSYYNDSVYADPTIPNRIWFTNFDNMGANVYGTLNCNSTYINIPLQTVGGKTYSGTGNFSTHYLSLSAYVNSSYCSITLN